VTDVARPTEGTGGPADRAAERFSIVERVRFGDLDAMQHLNNVEFLRYFETARIDYMKHLVPEHRPTERGEFGYIFAECQIAYRSPAFFDEEVRVYIDPGELRRSSFELRFEMRAESDGRLLAEGRGVLVGYDYQAGRAARIPEEIRARLSRNDA
jgi:acyl-CoA thioester hydrolase